MYIYNYSEHPDIMQMMIYIMITDLIEHDLSTNTLYIILNCQRYL